MFGVLRLGLLLKNPLKSTSTEEQNRGQKLLVHAGLASVSGALFTCSDFRALQERSP